MSLYSYNFTLLQPPKRSSLSLGDENTRAIIPNFENVGQLKEFVSRLFDFKFQVTGFEIQLKIAIGFECMILFISSLIISRRIYEGNFWIYRLVRTSTGSIIIPNTMLAFIISEIPFKIIFLTFLIESLKFYNDHSDGPPNFLLWILLPWCSLIFGAFLAAIGTFYATPRGIRYRMNNHEIISNKLKRFLLHAQTANFIAFSIPIITCISIFIPSFIGNAHFMQARSQQISWLKRYIDSNEFSQEMVLEVQSIWYRSLRGMKLVSITFGIWFAWAMICFLIYTSLSYKLLTSVLDEMKKKTLQEMRFRSTTLPLPIQDCIIDEAIHSNDVPLNNFPQLQAIQMNQDDSICETAISRDDQTNWSSIQSNDHLLSHGNKGIKSEKISNLIINQNDLNKKAKEIQIITIHQQKKELRKALLNIFAQVLVISPGCIIMGGAVLYFGLTLYGGYEQPTINEYGIGTQFERFFGVGIVLIIWSIVFLGLFIFCCVLFRVYEPIFVKIQNDLNSPFNSNLVQSAIISTRDEKNSES